MRRHDWPEKLADYLDDCAERPFTWGSHDCCQFAAGAVAAMTGVNPAAQFSYGTEAEAAALLEQHGGVAGLATLTLGESVHPAKAGRGDVVLANLSGGPSLGVLVGNECAFAAARGLVFWPRAVATQAWRIG